MIPEDEEEEDFGGVNEVYNVLYARNKLKRCRKRRNIFIVSIVAAVLVITIIVFAVLYRQELGKSISGTAVTDIRRGKQCLGFLFQWNSCYNSVITIGF